MLPPETIIAVADDDMFYYPDWLAEHLDIFNTFPRVGTVSGWPVRTQFRFHNKFTLDWGQRFASAFERGKFISEQEERDFCASVERDYKWHKGYTKKDIDTRLTFRGVEAYAEGHHCQWLGKAGTIAPLLSYSKEAMADERPFEYAVDAAQLLRLTTTKRVTRHIGNVLDEELEALWREIRS
jgi:hypothetical protein